MTARRASRLGAIELPVRRLHVELTNRCNFSCEFCPDRSMRRPRGTMPLSMVEELLAQAGQENLARQVHFHVMGEPLLYPDLPEAVRFARSGDMEAWVTTNGSLLTPELLMELQAAGLSHLTISLQTPDAPTFALRGSRFLAFEQYRERLIGTVRAFLPHASGMRLSLCFLSNPLRRFHAPGASNIRVAESGRELRAHMGRWVEWIFGGTALERQVPDLLVRLKGAGILTEAGVPMTAHLDLRVRVLGNWAGHFEGPIVPARFGYCPGLSENFGILWNGDYVICCADYDGRTVLANCSEKPLREYLSLPAVQEIAGGFRRYRVVHPHCRQCLGDRHLASSFLRQAGSIAYFKVYRKLLHADSLDRGVA
ncbi:MAG TPA: radical SAM protein [Candidatus Methylomirabilis sp.]|nr:radical SAM protein [Candidatus Methylomirabilis sp.]